MKNRILILIFTIFLVGCNENEPKETEPEIISYRKILKNKHMENYPIGNRGDFIVKHYFLYTDDELEEVDLKDYMKFNIGDTIYFNQIVN